MTDLLFFDTDCLSAFLWVDNQSILSALYSGRIIIPAEVYNELSYPYTKHLKKKVDSLISYKKASIRQISIPSREFDLYEKFTNQPEKGYKIIGKGEAACLAFAIIENGIIASNNLRDISKYVSKYKLKHLTTGDILFEAYSSRLISIKQGDKIWQDMLNKKRYLGFLSFSEYLDNHK